MTRPLYLIAQDIRADFASKGKPVHPYAKPYVDAMAQLDFMTDSYYADTAETVVLYALSNLSTWRGDKAREVKAELKTMLAKVR